MTGDLIENIHNDIIDKIWLQIHRRAIKNIDTVCNELGILEIEG